MKTKLSLALLATIITSSVAAQSNTIRFENAGNLPSIPAYSNGVSTPAESPTLLEMMPVNFNSTVTSALMATKDGEPVPMSSCLAYIDAGLGQGNDGLYQITNNGSTYPVYCNQTSFGGGFTLVVAQFESSPVVWSGWNNGFTGGPYDPSLASKNGFSLNSVQMPVHTQMGFSQQDYDALSVPNYLSFVYSTGDISISGQNAVDVNGVGFHVSRNLTKFYNYHDPDGGSGAVINSSVSVWRNTLTIDMVGQRGLNWAFAPHNTTSVDRSYSYGGHHLQGVSRAGGFFVWVR